MKSTRKESVPFSGYQIFVIAILALLQFTVVMDFAIISPLGDMLMKGLSINTAQFGLLVSCYAFGAGVAGVLAAGFADKFDRKKFLLFFYAGFIVGTLLCGLSKDYTMLMIARSVTGLFGGVIASISMSIVSDLFPLSQRGRVMGFIQMAFAGSQILGIPVGLFVANAWGWNATFILIVALATIVFIAIAARLKPIKGHLSMQTDESVFGRFHRVLTNKEHFIGFVMITMVSMGGAMLMPFSAAYLINNVDVTQEQLPYIFLFSGLISLIVMPLVGRLSDRVDKFKLFFVGSCITIVMTLVYTNLPPIPLWGVVIVNMLMFVGIGSRMVPGMALNTAIPDPRDRGAYMSMCTTLQQTSNGLGALAAGLIVVQHTKTSPLEHFNILGLIVVSMSIVCIFLIYRINNIVKAKQVA